MACRAGEKETLLAERQAARTPHFLRHRVSSYATWPEVGKVGSLRVIYKPHMWAFSCTVAVARKCSVFCLRVSFF